MKYSKATSHKKPPLADANGGFRLQTKQRHYNGGFAYDSKLYEQPCYTCKDKAYKQPN